ncbi:MAG: hypothetical protein CBC38_04185 [Gammaproteobacteria bacterium TMED78]|nr:MAG: hypothetical protein CBC38_04185 [Gammaproteobacteria bacterium TMED78]
MKKLTFRYLGKQPLYKVWQEMKYFTHNRNFKTNDEVWFAEHPPVYTMGMNSNESHILEKSEIPILNLDRGGQVTYHGPGQLIVYMMFDLKRLKIGIRDYVISIEKIIIETVKYFGVDAIGKRSAPGVYVGGRKIAAIGLKVKKNCSYHGFSLNIDMDTKPFNIINPCGYEGLEVTQLKDLCGVSDLELVSSKVKSNINLIFNDIANGR